ncbi:MAG: lamin tail domain-containing protein, partial [Prolixibacteraceae bacterium]|nr:lamin tail domain-containing protein [Prolixibacteraceae bacterium]
MLLIVNVMLSNILKLLTFLILFSGEHATAQEIWKENFEIPGKGVWGDEDGVTIHSDFSGVTNWTLNFDNTTLTSPDDYAKTVATSGGRFECRDIDGEVVWRSSIIDISSFKQVSIQLTAYETGSGANQQNKYLKAFYKLNGGDEILFGKNGENIGNWGSNLAQQSALTGQTLQIIVYMENHYSNDKVTLDEVVVTGETADSTAPFITSVKLESATKLRVFFNEPIGEVTLANFEITHNNKAKMHIESAEKVEGQPNQVVLQISPLPFYDLQLLAQNIFDLDGNLQPGNIYPFEYLPPVASHDVIINELMPDPNPVVGLPDAEYIELFSNALYPVNIENWSLKINNVEKKLPRFILSPSGFLLLCSTSSEELLLTFGDVIAVPGFQGLRNTGALIEIFDEKGEKIDRILYSTDLFGNAEKDNGGWSLERIDPKR